MAGNPAQPETLDSTLSSVVPHDNGAVYLPSVEYRPGRNAKQAMRELARKLRNADNNSRIVVKAKNAERMAENRSKRKVATLPETLEKLASEWEDKTSLTARSELSLEKALADYTDENGTVNWVDYCRHNMTRKGKRNGGGELFDWSLVDDSELIGELSGGYVVSPRLPDTMGRVDSSKVEKLWTDSHDDSLFSAVWWPVASMEQIPALVASHYLASVHRIIKPRMVLRAVRLIESGNTSLGLLESLQAIETLLKLFRSLGGKPCGGSDLTRYARGLGRDIASSDETPKKRARVKGLKRLGQEHCSWFTIPYGVGARHTIPQFGPNAVEKSIRRHWKRHGGMTTRKIGRAEKYKMDTACRKSIARHARRHVVNVPVLHLPSNVIRATHDGPIARLARNRFSR